MRRLMALARIDARRPAAWLSLAVALAVAAMLPAASPEGWPGPAVAATLLGAAVAVMALGDAAPAAVAADIDLGRWAERAAWPLLGWGIAAGPRGDFEVLACGELGILSAAGLVAALVRRGALGADAASAALVAAGASTAAGWWADAIWPTRMPGGAIAAGLLALAALGVAVGLHSSPAIRSGLRRLLTAAGMAGAIAGMVGWLFLAVDRAALDLTASLAWFAALAVPPATLGDGVSHAAVWRRLERAAPRAQGARPRPPPGRTRDGVLAVLTAAAILGWPPLVAAALSGAGLAGAWPAASVPVALAGAAGVLLLVAWVCERAAVSPATAHAAALACAILAVAGALAYGAAAPIGGPVFSGFR